MDAFLIRFNGKHISAAKLAMADDHVLKAFIHNMGKPAILEIRGHLQAGKVPDKFKGSWILMNRLKDNFNELAEELEN
ncbi:hypothetical protein GOBAR_AA18920 [Gossypium barbadense]|uniref:Uncharacterized protein n=1 Tax=Gossypium barbadense TaxID=3634 RepID=A0A2P5XEL9_GOSBA|nr:hypothetical protein GOBAR_AA18920 [Gossypium barbadense]